MKQVAENKRFKVNVSVCNRIIFWFENFLTSNGCYFELKDIDFDGLAIYASGKISQTIFICRSKREKTR